MRETLLLASSSPRRTDLLSQAGITHTVMPVNIEETWRPGEPPAQFARRLATSKAEAAAQRRPQALVLGADTVVWESAKDKPIGKPSHREQARQYLLRFTNAECPHFVTTAFALVEAGTSTPLHVAQETTRVWMRRISPQELEDFLDSGEWQDKAGGYAIQGRAAAFVTRIEGSYTNVVGLPLAQVVEALQRLRS